MWAFPHSSIGKESACSSGDLSLGSWVRKISWRRDRLPTPVFLGFPCDSVGKESTCNVGNLGSTPGLGRSGEGKGYPLQCSGLENFVDCIVHGITKSWTRLSDFHFHIPCVIYCLTLMGKLLSQNYKTGLKVKVKSVVSDSLRPHGL